MAGVSNLTIVSMPKRRRVDDSTPTVSYFLRSKRQNVETEHTDNERYAFLKNDAIDMGSA